MDILKVDGIEMTAYHGCIDEEAKVGGKFTINTAFWGDFKTAAREDDLYQAIDYVTVAQIVKEEMLIRNKLIETVAYRILDHLEKKFPQAEKIEVTIIKHRAPIELPVKQVSITVSN